MEGFLLFESDHFSWYTVNMLVKDAILHAVENISFAIGIIGVIVLLWWVIRGLFRFLHAEMHLWDKDRIKLEHEEIRNDLGYYLLLGMEFLVAADIIHTILSPTLQDLAVLGAIVAIRVVLSFFLQKEISE